MPKRSANLFKITRNLLRQVAGPGADTWWWDSEIPGFGLRRAAGRLTYVLRFRAGGRDRKITLGDPAILAPEEARTAARRLRVEVKAGSDPAAARAASRIDTATARVEDLRDWFQANHAATLKGGVESGQGRNQEGHWRLHIIPRLGGRRVADITTEDMYRLRTAMMGSPVNCNRVFETLRIAFRFAEKPLGWRAPGTNPCDGVTDFPERKRQHILTPADMQRVLNRLEEVDRIEHPHRIVATMVRLYLLTGLRKRELSMLRWDDDGIHPFFHAGRRTIVLHDDKAGVGREVGLPAAAADILDALPREGVWAFPSCDPSKPLEDPLHAFHALVRAPLGLPRLRIHDLRHTFGSYAHASGASQKEVATMLGHRQMSTAERYIGAMDARMIEAREKGVAAIFGNHSSRSAASSASNESAPALGISASIEQW